jgi:hypothetical protein
MITHLDLRHWTPSLSPELCETATDQLEAGSILLFEQLAFPLTSEETVLLTPGCLAKGRKNISYDFRKNSIKGVTPHIPQAEKTIQAMMHRFAAHTQSLLSTLLPAYQNAWEIGRTSFRPAEIASRAPLSKQKDDRLLHVDAFPTTPVGGKRILRFFCNINPAQSPRRWRTGEAFSEVTKRFVPHMSGPRLPLRRIKQLLGITRGYQTLYDFYMVKLHNAMKTDPIYQQQFEGIYDFPAGASWLIFTDFVSHAAIAGQHLLEQTFYLPVDAMKTPDCSPLRILEKTLERGLV